MALYKCFTYLLTYLRVKWSSWKVPVRVQRVSTEAGDERSGWLRTAGRSAGRGGRSTTSQPGTAGPAAWLLRPARLLPVLALYHALPAGRPQQRRVLHLVRHPLQHGTGGTADDQQRHALDAGTHHELDTSEPHHRHGRKHFKISPISTTTNVFQFSSAVCAKTTPAQLFPPVTLTFYILTPK